MSVKLEKYDLDENPFVDLPIINIWATDRRFNGRLFCDGIVKDQYNKLLSLIQMEVPAAYVNSTASVLGTGKSALMAAVHWKLFDEGKNVIWVESTGGLSSAPTLGRVIDSIVAQGIYDKMKSKIGDVNYERIKGMLSSYYSPPSPTLTSALMKVMSTETEETAKKFANIRRSILISSAVELFGYFISLMMACGFSRPIIFVDQFEEFVQSHRGASQLRILGDDLNDLFRTLQNRATLIFSLHPEAEYVLMSAAGKYVQTFAPINSETTVIIPQMKPDDGVKLASFYLSEYRKKGSQKPAIYPFSGDFLKYVCIKSFGSPRSFLRTLHYAILEGAVQDYRLLDSGFLSDPVNHARILPGLPSEWEKFIRGELT